jgi:hypothetical protein
MVAIRGGIKPLLFEFVMQGAQFSKKEARCGVFGSGEAKAGMECVGDSSNWAVGVNRSIGTGEGLIELGGGE